MVRGSMTVGPDNRSRAIGSGARTIFCAALIASLIVLPAQAEPPRIGAAQWWAAPGSGEANASFRPGQAPIVEEFGLAAGAGLLAPSLSVDARLARAYARVWGAAIPQGERRGIDAALLRIDAPIVVIDAGTNIARWRAGSATLRQRARGEILLMASDRAPEAARVDLGATPTGTSPAAWVRLSVLDPDDGGVVVESRTASPGGGMTLVRAHSETEGGSGALGLLWTDGKDLNASAFAMVWDDAGTAVLSSGDQGPAQVMTIRQSHTQATGQHLSLGAAPVLAGNGGWEISPGGSVSVGTTRQIVRHQTMLAATGGPAGEAGLPEIAIMTSEQLRSSSRGMSINATITQPLGGTDALVVGALGGVTFHDATLARSQQAVVDGATLADFGTTTASRRGFGLSGMLSVGVKHRLSHASALTLGVGGWFASGVPAPGLERVSTPDVTSSGDADEGGYTGTGETYERSTITTTRSGGGVVFLRYEFVF